MMQFDSSQLTYPDGSRKVSFSLVETQTGTKENAVCSGRGLCDPTVGFCGCAVNFDTSNGYNSPGTRGDCGYVTNTVQVGRTARFAPARLPLPPPLPLPSLCFAPARLPLPRLAKKHLIF